MRIFIAALQLLSALFVVANTHAQSYEQPPILAAREALPQTILENKLYTVAPAVTNDGYMNSYTVKSKYGEFTTRGTYFMIKLATEIEVLQFIETNFPTHQVVLAAAGDTAVDIATAPVRATKKVYDTVSDTDKLSSTVKSIPGGVANIFKFAADSVGTVATTAYDVGKSAVTGGKKDSDKSTGSEISKAYSMAEDAALDFIGYNKAYRDIAQVLKVDPFTENTVLRSELVRIASLRTSVRVGSRFVPTLSIPGIGTASRYLGYAEKTAAYEDPKKVDELNRKVFDALGKGGDKERFAESAKAFFDNDSYTPVMRKVVLDTIKKLDSAGTSNLEKLLEAAAKASSRAIAQFYVLAISKLGELHTKKDPLVTVIRNGTIPAAVSKSGHLYIPLPVDHLVWTEYVAKIFTGVHDTIEPSYGVKQSTILIGGTVSKRCEAELRKLGAEYVKTGVEFRI